MEDEDPWAGVPSSPKPPQSPSSSTASQSHTLPHNIALPSSPISPLVSRPPIAPPPASIPSSPNNEAEEDNDNNDGFDDFDDNPEAGHSGGFQSAPPIGEDGDGDGFGDFGDFEEGDFDEPQSQGVNTTTTWDESQKDQTSQSSTTKDQSSQSSTTKISSKPDINEKDEQRQSSNNTDKIKNQQNLSKQWVSLRLRPVPPRIELLDQLQELLEPIVPSKEESGSLTDEPLRQVGGIRQIMVSGGSQDAYVQLNTPPVLKPLDWTRSRVRREHLISMGVPVNLDEVDSHRLTAMPPLRISVGNMGPPPVPNPRAKSSSRPNSQRPSVDFKGKGKEENSNGFVASPVAVAGGSSGLHGLGERPELDMEKAEELCGLEEDRLTIMPLATLHAMQNELVEVSSQASALLAWLLQLKDAQSQDAATYNGMISELIANAAKAKSAQQAGSGGVFRRASGRQARPASQSGSVTPRIGSPAMR